MEAFKSGEATEGAHQTLGLHRWFSGPDWVWQASMEMEAMGHRGAIQVGVDLLDRFRVRGLTPYRRIPEPDTLEKPEPIPANGTKCQEHGYDRCTICHKRASHVAPPSTLCACDLLVMHGHFCHVGSAFLIGAR